MALAGDQHDVRPARASLSAVAIASPRSWMIRARVGLDAADDVAGDRLRILGARIVVGDDDLIGEFIGDRAHQRALARIAVAAAAEHAPQRAVAMFAQRAKAFASASGVCA